MLNVAVGYPWKGGDAGSQIRTIGLLFWREQGFLCQTIVVRSNHILIK